MEPKTIFMTIWVLMAAFALIAGFLKGKKALSIFPDISSERIIFRDKFASGYSTYSFWTRIGSARNVLDIVVTEKELWLKSTIMFAGIMSYYDLINKIALNNIIAVNKKGQGIELEFKTDSGKIKQVVILSKKPIDFLKALRIN
jgi:hypothetical protein